VEYFEDRAKAAVRRRGRGEWKVDVEMGVQEAEDGAFVLEVGTLAPGAAVGQAYSGVRNFVVRVGRKVEGEWRRDAVVVNSHLDSAPASYGASDAMSMCAVMLEVFKNILARDPDMKRDVVFLFNGAEEIILLGSHAFVSQHPWAKHVKVLINLESAGVGHKSVMLWCGPHRQLGMARIFQRYAPYPHASSAVQDIFENGFVPADTDHRIFRTFAGIPGFDFANYMNGYRYHTFMDNIEGVGLGFLQQNGENTHALIEALTGKDSDENWEALFAPENDTPAHIFDVLGLFVVVYSQKVGFVVHGLVLLLGAVQMLFSMPTLASIIVYQASCLTAGLLGLVLFLLVSALTAVVISAGFGLPMLWIGRHWLVIPLYCSPATAATLFYLFYATRALQRYKAIRCDGARPLEVALDVYARLAGLLLAATWH